MVHGQLGSKKILLRSPNWVGDAIMAIPTAVALKKTFPNASIHILARPWVAPLWQHHPAIDKIIILEKKAGFFKWFKLIHRVRREKYTLTILLTNAFSAAWLAFWSAIPGRVGYRTDQRGWLLSQPVAWNASLLHVARPKLYLTLAKEAGADIDLCEQWDFSIKLTPEEIQKAKTDYLPKGKKQLIGIAPGSVAQSRRWPAKRYAQIADQLSQAGWQVILLGSPSDKDIAQQVKRLSKSKPPITAGETDLRTGLAVMRQTAMVISNDSGAMHMAYAQGIPVLVLQGAADPAVTGPFGKASVYLRDETLDCAPCVRNECRFKELKCMQNITTEQVWEKVCEMLNIKSRKPK